MNLGIVGSRRRNTAVDKAIIKSEIESLKPDLIISGGCPRGADQFAHELAKELGIPILIYFPKLPDTDAPLYEFTKAYYARNKQIAEKSDVLLALAAPDRMGGTENTISYFNEKLFRKQWLENADTLLLVR